jgi:hypothetical protein
MGERWEILEGRAAFESTELAPPDRRLALGPCVKRTGRSSEEERLAANESLPATSICVQVSRTRFWSRFPLM